MMELKQISLAEACADMNELAKEYAPHTKVLFAIFVKKPIPHNMNGLKQDGYESVLEGGTADCLEALAERVRQGGTPSMEVEIGGKAYTLWLNPQMIEKEEYERVQSG